MKKRKYIQNTRSINKINTKVPSSGNKAKKRSLDCIKHREVLIPDRFQDSKKYIKKAEYLGRSENTEDLLEDVKGSNFVELWDRENEEKACCCSGTLVQKNNIEIYFHIDDKRVSILIPGKECEDCKKYFVEKSIFMKSIFDIQNEK